eukprot:10140725-Heterocapsa_arctica.AAC.1
MLELKVRRTRWPPEEWEKQTRFGFPLKDMMIRETMIRKMRIIMKPHLNIPELFTTYSDGGYGD